MTTSQSFPNPSPRVSVIMPAFNAEKYIAASIQSVLDQTFSDWQLIVIDDGSSDGTSEIVRALANTQSRITLLQQQNGGQGSARNLGIKNSQGEFIALLDADDLWLPHKLELQVPFLEKQRADVIYSEGFFFSGDEATDESHPMATLHGRFAGSDFFALLLQRNWIPVLSVFARRDTLERVSLFEERRVYQNCEDYDLWLRLAHDGAVFHGMPDRLVRYRVHEGSVSRREIEMLRAHLAVLQKWRDHPFFDTGIARRRRRTLYRALMLALMKEGRTGEARRSLRELDACGRFDPITMLQRALLQCSPNFYAPIIERLQRFKLRVSQTLTRRS